MEYRKLGRTGQRVSEVGLGTWPIGGSIVLGGAPTGYGEVPESEAVRAIRHGLERGVSFFDSADTYGLGRAERILGQAIAGRHGQVVVATKVGWVPDGAERWVADLSPEHLRAAAERSRRRLGVDVIDVLQLHPVPAEGDETEAALDALEAIRAAGICRLIGVSVGSDFAAGMRLLATDRVHVVQVHFNLLQQGAAAELLDEAQTRGAGVIASIPLAYGFLSGRYTRATVFPDDDWRSRLTPQERAARVERTTELRFLTGDGARTMVQCAVQFALSHPAVSTTIPGFKTPEQVEELVSAPDAPALSDIELARARDVARAHVRPAAAPS
jgi:aryl-alcohol dehydrogenase-like predicted oxidoreductase